MVRERDGRPQEDLLMVHCFCVCSRSALLGDLLGVSRSTERDLMSVLSYSGLYLSVSVFFYLGCLILISYSFVFVCIYCVGLVVSTQ